MQTIQNHSSFNLVMQNILYYGRKKYGPKFKLYKEDKETWIKLFAYFTRQKELCDEFNIDLRKGLMLSGPVGCGKTSMLVIWNMLLSNASNYVIRSANQLALEFAKDGYGVILHYGNLKSNLLIDDLGTEQNILHYGNKSNVLMEILTLRHDTYINFGFKTHLTTNLLSKQIQNEYGIRIRSRLKTMLIKISFDSGCDKRV